MRKWIIWCLTVLMLASLLAGCGKKEPAVSQELMDRFAGDWNGVVAFQECTGKYEDSLGGGMTGAIARFVVDDKGNITPFIGLHVEDTPIQDLTATFSVDRSCILVSGSWISVPFQDAELTEDQGLLRLDLPLSKEEGSVKLVFRLRRLDDRNWTEEEPYLSESNVEYCYGKSFDELAQINGYSPDDYPSVGGSGDSGASDENEPAQEDQSGSLLGSWEAVTMQGAIYSFEEGGKGAYIYGTTTMPFTYKVVGDSVEILFEGNTMANTYKFQIKGDILQIEDSFGDTVEYKKQ